jgi:hypothetical protein
MGSSRRKDSGLRCAAAAGASGVATGVRVVVSAGSIEPDGPDDTD